MHYLFGPAQALASIMTFLNYKKNALCIITNSKYNAHTEPLFKKLEILPLPDLITYSKIQFMHRFVHNHLPASFLDTWGHVQNRNPDNHIVLRNTNNIDIPFARLTSTSKFPLTAFPKTWQDFPDLTIKNIQSKNKFDQNLKKYFFDDLSTIITCNRLFCPSCSGTDNPANT